MASGVSGTKGGSSPAVAPQKINNLPEVGEFDDPYFLKTNSKEREWMKNNTDLDPSEI